MRNFEKKFAICEQKIFAFFRETFRSMETLVWTASSATLSLLAAFRVTVILAAPTIWDALIVSLAASLTTGAALWVPFMLAVLTIRAAPGAVPRVSAMLPALTVQAAPWAFPRVSAMLAVLAIRAAPWAVPAVSCAVRLGSLSYLTNPAAIPTTDVYRATLQWAVSPYSESSGSAAASTTGL